MKIIPLIKRIHVILRSTVNIQLLANKILYQKKRLGVYLGRKTVTTYSIYFPLPNLVEKKCLLVFKRTPFIEGKLWANGSNVKLPPKLSRKR